MRWMSVAAIVISSGTILLSWLQVRYVRQIRRVQREIDAMRARREAAAKKAAEVGL